MTLRRSERRSAPAQRVGSASRSARHLGRSSGADKTLRAVRYVSRATRAIIPHYLRDGGSELAAHLAETNERVPPLVAEITDEGAKIGVGKDQLSWGVTRRGGKFVVAILISDRDIRAKQLVKQLAQTYQGMVFARSVGTAHSSDPQNHYSPVPSTLYSNGAICPGASVGHIRGFPGSLGCLVRSTVPGQDWIGVLSASHVLAMNNRAKKGDIVLSPAAPDGSGLDEDQCGTLERYKLLVDFDKELHGANQVCCVDVALVKLEEKRDVPECTMVPNPRNSHKLMRINRVIGGDEVADQCGWPVYKVGRTTGFTKGVLDIVGLQRQPILLNGTPYLYTNILTVRHLEKPFSKPGDSGALVYTSGGEAVGLVIGGTDEVSFLSPFDACLRDIKATLL